MGKNVFTRDAHIRASAAHVPTTGPATARAEQRARETGKIDPLVDPKGYGVIRPSRPRFEPYGDNWQLTIGVPVPLEYRLDTTGSMGDNVDRALKALPDLYEMAAQMLPGSDLQICSGIFGDVRDTVVMCRGQFEMEAPKIVQQLTLMVPCRDGHDFPEDPHYGLFGAAYLTDTYINRIGLKGYDFTISDAPARDRLDEFQLHRIFGESVFDKVAENRHQIRARDLPTTKEVVQDLLKRAHAFFLQVDDNTSTRDFWSPIFGRERIIVLPKIELLPHVQAVLIGLTEGLLDLQSCQAFLRRNNVGEVHIQAIIRSVANIPMGAQKALPNYSRRPQKGDLFAKKTDLWPIDTVTSTPQASDGNKPGFAWL